MTAPRLRARRVVVALSSREGRGVARMGVRVWVGKKRRARMAGRLRRASRAKAVWIIEGMVGRLGMGFFGSVVVGGQ